MPKAFADNDAARSKMPKKNKWTKDEIKLLQKSVQKYGCNWFQIAQQFSKRNPNQCAQKWKRLKGQRSRIRVFWNAEEDQRLIDLVSDYGRCWADIAKQMKNRTNKQCRDRYLNILDPTLKSDDFSQEEDYHIYLQYIQRGSRWTEISKELNRSENQVKNRFYTHIRRHYLQVQNPHYTKLSQENAKQIMANARENHLLELQLQIAEQEIMDVEQRAFESNSNYDEISTVNLFEPIKGGSRQTSVEL